MSKRDEPEDDRHTPDFEHRVRNGIAAKTIVIPERQIEEIAMRAGREGGLQGVREGVREVFRQLGVDFDNIDSINRFTRDLINLRDYSNSLEKRKDAVKTTITDIAVSAIKWLGAVGALYVIHLIYLDLHK